MMDFGDLLTMWKRAAPGARQHGLPPQNPAPLGGKAKQPGAPAQEDPEEPRLSGLGKLAVKAGEFSKGFYGAGGTSGLPRLFEGFASVAALIAGENLPAWRKWKAEQDKVGTARGQRGAPPSEPTAPPPVSPPAATVGLPPSAASPPPLPGQSVPPPVPASALPVQAPAPPPGPFTFGSWGIAPPFATTPATPTAQGATPTSAGSAPTTPVVPPTSQVVPPSVAPSTFSPPIPGPETPPPAAAPGAQAPSAPPRPGLPLGQRPATEPRFRAPQTMLAPPGTSPPAGHPPAPFAGPQAGSAPAPAANPPLSALIAKILQTPGARRFGFSPAHLAAMPESAVRDMAGQLGVGPAASAPSRTPTPGGIPSGLSGSLGGASLAPQSAAQNDMREVVALLQQILDELRKRPKGDEEEDESETQENRRPAWRKVEEKDETTQAPRGASFPSIDVPLIMRPPMAQNPAHFQ